MADNVAITAGAGTTIATDDVTDAGGAHYQKIKIADGAANSTSMIGGDATNGLDVDVTRVKPDGTNTMPSLDAAARRGYVQVTDGTNSATVIATINSLKADLSSIAGSATPVSNGVNTNALRVTIANDSTGVLDVGGKAAHDAALSGNPVRIGVRGVSTDQAVITAGRTADVQGTLLGKVVNFPYAIPGSTWNYAGPSGGITDTADDAVKAAGGAGVRHYITHIDVVNGHATVSTDVQLKDGSTVLHRGFAQAAGGGYSIDFVVPLRGTAATAVNVACGTTGSATYVNVVGFSAAE